MDSQAFTPFTPCRAVMSGYLGSGRFCFRSPGGLNTRRRRTKVANHRQLKSIECFASSTLTSCWLNTSGVRCLVRGARHSRGRAGSGNQPGERTVVDSRLRTPNNTVNIAFEKLATRTAKTGASNTKYRGRKRDLFWVVILYLIIVTAVMIASGVYLLS